MKIDRWQTKSISWIFPKIWIFFQNYRKVLKQEKKMNNNKWMNKQIELKVTKTEQCFCKKFKSKDGKSKPFSPHLFTAVNIYLYVSI